MAPKASNTKLTFTCKKSLRAKLEKRAEAESRTLSSMILFLVEKGMADYEAEARQQES